MTTTETRGQAPKTNGGVVKERKTRTKKELTAKSAGIKIAELLEQLPETDRAKALHIAKTLSEPVGA